MPDPFDIFSVPARPWLDPADLQSRFLVLAAKHHPDASQSSNTKVDEAAFCTINEAHKALQDPVTRLQHLLAKEAPGELAALSNHEVSIDIAEHFLTVATILREVSSFQKQHSISSSPLTRAVLRAEHLSLRRDLERAIAKMDDLWHQCESQIKAADTVWERRTPGILHQLAAIQREMTFLQKWRTQLREARLTMST